MCMDVYIYVCMDLYVGIYDNTGFGNYDKYVYVCNRSSNNIQYSFIQEDIIN